MIIPHEINKNVLKCYEVPDCCAKNTNQKIRSYDFTEWNKNIPDSLKLFSIKCIAKHWQDLPIQLDTLLYSDRSILLDYLPMDIPLKLAVMKLHDDYYWERKYKTFWPKEPYPNRTMPEYFFYKCTESTEYESESSLISKYRKIGEGSDDRDSSNGSYSVSTVSFESSKEKSWKQCFIEQYLEETLENLKPEEYDLDMIKDLVVVCRHFVTTMSLKELQAPKKSSGNIDHIPLNIVTSGLPFLTELSICFKQKYLRENFSWNAFKVSLQDIKFLGKGLEHCDLYSFRIQNSDIDCVKIKMLVESLMKNKNLKSLDFSHCEIADEGALTICKLIKKHPTLNKIVLTNNNIGCAGAKYFAILLCQDDCRLSYLDLKLNRIGEEGGKLITEALVKGGHLLRELCLAACCLRKSNWSIGKMIAKNNVLQSLDISSNRMGE
ncbi:dynein regulatory complex subunit 5-like, partial [Agrilus planipennis]|uniref:Dynein regulatory complex subunit 5-like n=1 Tax=Agrilus planipennis TaxID=224129 RepID=A0A1W4XFN5_AGRPL